ncbi:MAG: RICIN domain-containing protein [Ruminococcus sp.]|nr:RICIN domain-containing protein [Ruminococcus sp.]
MKIKKLISGITSAALAFSVFSGIGTRYPEKAFEAAAATANWKFDFGSGGVSSGFTGVSASDGYDASRGYGFAQTYNVGNVSAGGSGAGSDAVEFKSDDGANTFNVDLPKGLYEVKVTVGNAPRCSIKMEGMLQIMNLTRLNATETVKLPVTDGQLNIQAVTGIKNGQRSISAIEIKQINTTGEMPPMIWICGDSTVANYYNQADTAQHGWGQYFGSYAAQYGFEVRNMATSGQFAKGFVDGGQFEAIRTYGKTGDKYIISIGINDMNYSNADEYKYVVTEMTKEAKKKGMEVILVKQQGRHGDYNRSPHLTGRWFGGQLDEVGSEQNVQVVDLFNAWQDFGFSIGGFDAMTPYYASDDDLHQSLKGAQKIAELMSGLVFEPKEPCEMDTSKAYRFKNVNSGLYLEVKDGSAEVGANVQQWGGDTVGEWNTWRLKHKGYNYYEIWSYLGDGQTYLLDVADGSAANGANIALNTNKNYGAQWFRFFENSDGSYTMVSRCSGDKGAVEVASALTTSGANVQQWEVNGHDCQKWVLETVELTTETTTTTTTTTTTVTTSTTTDPGPVIAWVLSKRTGDANCDGQVNMADAVLIMQCITNPDKYQFPEERDPEFPYVTGEKNADVDGSGDVTNKDALYIQRWKLGLGELPPNEYIDVEVTRPTSTTTETSTTTTTTTAPADPWEGYYFAVDQIWDKGVVEELNTGYTKTSADMGTSGNTGYINLDNVLGSSIIFTVNAPETGKYMAYVRFANGAAADRKCKVIVNGNTDSYWMQSFNTTGEWTKWDALGIVLPLNAGENTIKFEAAVSDGGPNFDYLTITLTDEPVAELYDPNAQGPDVDNTKPSLFLAGDSTCMYYGASKQAQQGGPIQGWGYNLPDYFTDNVSIYNHAMAGRSSKKFYDDGRFQTIVDNLKQGDFVTIQFAINDAGKSYADRYAPVCGNVDNPSSGSYEWYMTSFIKDTMAKGATPILMSCTLGLKAYSDGRFLGSYTDYADACKRLAAKYNIPYIDVNSAMVSLYNSVGYDTAASYHMPDATHFNEDGAKVVAQLIANEIKKANISGLSNYVK